jgi:hypothetical protein
VQRPVQAPVSAPIEPIADNLARAGRDGSDPRQAGEGGLTPEAPRLRPGDEQRRRRDRSYPAPGKERGGERGNPLRELSLERLGL